MTDALGGTGTAIASLGDLGTAARYSSTSIALTSAAITQATLVPAGFFGLPYKVTAATQVLTATLALTSGSVTAAKTLAFLVEFIVEK